MFEEVRMVTRTGLPLANFPLSLSSGKREKRNARDMSLFAGFITASLSMFQELENENIDEIIYHDYKIVIHTTESVFYLCITSVKVPTSLTLKFLVKLATKMEYFMDFKKGLIEVNDRVLTKVQIIIDHVLEEEFWWAKPDYTLKNNLSLIRDVYGNPSGTFFVSTLPRKFIATGVILWAFVFSFALLVGTAFTGIGTYPTFNPALSVNFASMIAMWLGTGLCLKLIGHETVNFDGYLILSGIYSISLTPMIFFGSALYQFSIFDPIEEMTVGGPFATLAIVLIFWIPYNVSFFSYFILNGYSSSFVHFMDPKRYIVAYTSVMLFVLAVLSVLFNVAIPFNQV